MINDIQGTKKKEGKKIDLVIEKKRKGK